MPTYLWGFCFFCKEEEKREAACSEHFLLEVRECREMLPVPGIAAGGAHFAGSTS